MVIVITASLVEAITDSNLQQNYLCTITEVGIISFMLIPPGSLL